MPTTTPQPGGLPASARQHRLLAHGRTALAWLLVTVACLAVFGLYTAPEFMRLLADQLWSCF